MRASKIHIPESIRARRLCASSESGSPSTTSADASRATNKDHVTAYSQFGNLSKTLRYKIQGCRFHTCMMYCCSSTELLEELPDSWPASSFDMVSNKTDKAEPDSQTVTSGQSPIQHCALTHDTVHSSGCGVTALREYQICHRAKSGNPLEQIWLRMLIRMKTNVGGICVMMMITKLILH